MNDFKKKIQLRWSDLDPNFHVRHSAFYDWGALCRMEFMYQHGLTPEAMLQLNIGFILFREECIFRREVRWGHDIEIDMQMVKAKDDFSRFSLQHNINIEQGKLCAVITVDGAWMDLEKRKLTMPPQKVKEVFTDVKRTENFEWL